jgi:hypothetical protein
VSRRHAPPASRRSWPCWQRVCLLKVVTGCPSHLQPFDGLLIRALDRLQRQVVIPVNAIARVLLDSSCLTEHNDPMEQSGPSSAISMNIEVRGGRREWHVSFAARSRSQATKWRPISRLWRHLVVYLAGADNVSGPVTSCPHWVNQPGMNAHIEVQSPVTPSLPAFGHTSPPQRHDPLAHSPLTSPVVVATAARGRVAPREDSTHDR